MRTLRPALLAALLPTLITGAAGARAAVGRLQQPELTREVYPFEVLDADGEPYAHPFLGGLNIPRPQLVDIDGDGDRDLFVQEYSSAVMFFEQVGTDAVPEYRFRTDSYQDAEIGEWYLFVDLDKDGDYDLLGEERFSLVRYYRNDGGPTEPTLRLLTNTLLDPDDEPVFSDRQNIPKLGDLDCDGRLDLMIGRVEGTVTRFEEDGVDDVGAPRFRHVEDRFEDIEIIGQVLGVPGQQQQGAAARPVANGDRRAAGTSALHGANTMALHDWDGDGDLDLFWGDFFEPGLLLIENHGSCGNPSMRAQPRPFPLDRPVRTSGYNAPAFGDIDGDGDDDLLVGVLGGAYNPNDTTIDNFLHLENTGSRRFALRTRRFVTSIDVGSESFPAFGDLDGDGDLDMLLGNKIEPGDTAAGRLFRFDNIGTPTEPRYRLVGAMEGFDEAYHHAPALGDLDADGDLDMILGIWDDEIALVRNEGSAAEARWVVVDAEFLKLTRGRNATPTLGDVDGDGDLDLFVGESSGELNFYRNIGSAETPEFELVSDKFQDIDAGRRSAPTLADLDGDGDLDLFVGSEGDGLQLFRNDGTATAPEWVRDESFGLPVYPFTTPAFADVDGDGDLDLFAGAIGGGLTYFEQR